MQANFRKRDISSKSSFNSTAVSVLLHSREHLIRPLSLLFTYGSQSESVFNT